jgi:hypothetical protein
MWRGVRYEEDPQSRGNTRVQTGAWHPEKARNESRGLLGTGEFPRIANQSAGTCMDLVASPALPLPLISPTPPPSRRVRLQHGPAPDLSTTHTYRGCSASHPPSQSKRLASDPSEGYLQAKQCLLCADAVAELPPSSGMLSAQSLETRRNSAAWSSSRSVGVRSLSNTLNRATGRAVALLQPHFTG